MKEFLCIQASRMHQGNLLLEDTANIITKWMSYVIIQQNMHLLGGAPKNHEALFNRVCLKHKSGEKKAKSFCKIEPQKKMLQPCDIDPPALEPSIGCSDEFQK